MVFIFYFLVSIVIAIFAVVNKSIILLGVSALFAIASSVALLAARIRTKS